MEFTSLFSAVGQCQAYTCMHMRTRPSFSQYEKKLEQYMSLLKDKKGLNVPVVWAREH